MEKARRLDCPQVNMRLCLLSSSLIYTYFLLCCSAVPRARDYLKISGRSAGSEYVPSKPWAGGPGREPSCEELLAMWRFSKRQSRASEISNEISAYRDPFAYNVWEPAARSRSGAGQALARGGGGRHVYGRVVHAAPRSRAREPAPPGRARAYEQVARHMVAQPARPASLQPRRRVTAFRYSGGGGVAEAPALTPQAGSFQQLKDLIRSERARELQQQRLAEEEAARAAALRGAYRSQDASAPGYEGIRYGRRSSGPAQDPDLEPESESEPDAEEAALLALSSLG